MENESQETQMWPSGPGVPGGDLKVPQDICEWASPEELTAWIQQELNEMSSHEPPGSPRAAVLSDPRLTVLAFAYARGVFDHEEIAKLCPSDFLYRALSGGVLSPGELLSFRSKHRELLVKVTVQLLIKATRQKFNLSGPMLPRDLRRRLQDNANDRLDNARHIDRGEEV